ncbi:helix-turn-helix domain-containing protein [Lactobacillus delbrueckii subsp. lactis]|uniref:helix-turn-helix domain-containing protein n=1 Tax=Lactobacillus delbrueckii TaxID=1584 RepID=UPI001E39FEEB|nr:helix-turn-helix domain-containing protein [Lactobacillus delbrueckii]MCD5503040.1 helix-turn-helix domain-containing protein [Lactobacillus delbrueckii subsp. lactis]
MARKQLMISMSDLPYHLGIKMRIYPSSQQKRIIAINCGVSRGVYNKLIAINSELLHLRKTGIYIQTVAERIETLELRKKKLSKYYSYMSVNDVDSLAVAQAKLNYNAAWNMFKKFTLPAFPNTTRKA